MMIVRLSLIVLLVLFNISLMSQDLTNIKDAEPLVLTGGISTNQILYGVSGRESSRDLYSYFLSGNMNMNFYNVVNVPFTFIYSNQQANFQHPFVFNQFGAMPTYKWIKLYVGYNTMTFSKYTLNGHMFLGAGIELTPPGVFKLSAMYGRFQKSVEEDTTNTSITPGFKRMGYAIKLGLEKEKDYLDVSMFKAKDDVSSLTQAPVSVLPAENLVFGIRAGKAIGDHITLSIEAATSAFTRDIRSELTTSHSTNFIWKNTSFFDYRLSTSFHTAFNSEIKYQGKSFTVGLGYEKVAPEYKTLGAYYFNNDLENVTINSTKVLLKGKVSLAGNVGLQRNNLDGNKASSMKNIVSSINVNYTASRKLSLSGSYSNFNTFTHIKSNFETINQVTPYDNLDTLDFTLLSQTASVGLNYQLGDVNNEDVEKSISMNSTYQHAANDQEDNNSISFYYNGNLSYRHNLIKKEIIFSPSFNFNYSKMDSLPNTMTLGPTFTVSKKLLEKTLRTTLTTSINNTYSDGDKTSGVMNLRLIGTYTVKKSHNFNLSFLVLHRSTVINEIQKFTEYTVTIGYSYNFSSN